MKLRMDDVHLPQVRLVRVDRDARAVLHGDARMRVTFDAESRDQADRLLIRFGHAVCRAATHRHDHPMHRLVVHRHDRHASAWPGRPARLSSRLRMNDDARPDPPRACSEAQQHAV